MARTRNIRIRLGALALAGAWLLAGSACARAPQALVLATTTSVGNSGLLDAVLPHYRDATVRPLLVGSGRAIEMLARGDADVVISHAPAREAAALAAHPTWRYRKILYNDFLLVGPASDPARVGGSRVVVDAMRRIASSGAVFLSRGDESGTHERERELWQQAGRAPDSQHLVIAGAGMGQTLRIASSTGSYTLTDRGTFESLRSSLQLVPLVEGDARLMNTYAVIATGDEPRGLAFMEWMTEGEGRSRLADAIESGRVRGFSVWPQGAAAESPSAPPSIR